MTFLHPLIFSIFCIESSEIELLNDAMETVNFKVGVLK